MATETSAELRARAAQARRIGQNISNMHHAMEMNQIADSLEAQAEKLEKGEVPNVIPPPISEA